MLTSSMVGTCEPAMQFNWLASLQWVILYLQVGAYKCMATKDAALAAVVEEQRVLQVCGYGFECA
jgi:hypothetical protein